MRERTSLPFAWTAQTKHHNVRNAQ